MVGLKIHSLASQIALGDEKAHQFVSCEVDTPFINMCLVEETPSQTGSLLGAPAS